MSQAMKDILQEASDANKLALKYKEQVAKNEAAGGAFEVTIDKNTTVVSKEHFQREVVEAPIRYRCFGTFGGGQSNEEEDNGAEFVETLVERVETCSAPEDRRDALKGLKSVAKQYRLAVGTMGMNAYIDVLETDRLNSETMTLVLDTLATVLSADDDSSENDELGERLAEMMLKRKGFIASVLAAVDQTAVQLLSNLLRHRGTEVQNAVLQQPAGLSKLVDIIHDNREVIRNEAILMICELSRANSQIQQLLAYDNIFNDLLNIIETEPFDSIVIEDCLFVMLNLLRKNSMNQQLFRENQ
ncbi:hypothetical protein B9Z55_014553 [Caenorhabditis nigoni]|uniref:Uncharacterized protein n=1 Tax=Caenorhabditis nigoni TaxID=1611254 RepID=A0A2G5U6C6_9PELO|nr:hypothetical protein B9Z55_014553 [Caenorhabditis nigoni]